MTTSKKKKPAKRQPFEPIERTTWRLTLPRADDGTLESEALNHVNAALEDAINFAVQRVPKDVAARIRHDVENGFEFEGTIDDVVAMLGRSDARTFEKMLHVVERLQEMHETIVAERASAKTPDGRLLN
ncbi:MAG: hypothetical protein ACHREM_06235 [Polyangiales bacterium]